MEHGHAGAIVSWTLSGKLPERDAHGSSDCLLSAKSIARARKRIGRFVGRAPHADAK